MSQSNDMFIVLKNLQVTNDTVRKIIVMVTNGDDL